MVDLRPRRLLTG